jgi:hypothetical protein
MFLRGKMRGVAAWSAFVWLLSIWAGRAVAAPEKPVLVELFTSEGCSDCPPADRVLEELDRTQPFAGLHAIVLSEHVTYWDRLGWRDPFSLQQMTDRQQTYVDQFRLDSAYTPQMVVDGATQLVGSDTRTLKVAMDVAAERPKAELEIENARWENGAVDFSVRGAGSSDRKLIAALAADATQSQVARGENAGRTLHHVAVVRVMQEFGGDSSDGRVLKLPGGTLPSGPVRLVVFAVDRKTGQVQGAAERTLTR